MKGIAARAIPAIFVLLLAGSAMAEDASEKDSFPMTEREMVFVGFPHQGEIVEMAAWENRDEEAARQYYEELFVGKALDDVQEICRQEMEREERGEHDAQMITCRSGDDARFRIAYRFAMTTPDSEIPLAAMVWEVFLGFQNGVVDEVEVRPSILAV